MDVSSIIGLMQYAPKPFSFLSSLPQVAGTAYGLLSNPKGTLQGLSDKYLGTHFGQSDMMQEQGQINSDLANDERAWQERMIAEDRAYNSIENQMRMMREAGLNPGLLYGNIQDLGGTAPNAGAASVGLGSPQYGAVPEHDLLAAQVANINADTQKKFGETLSTQIKNKVDGMNAELFEQYYKNNKERILSVMSKELGLRENEIGMSNYELFAAAWNFSIQYGLSLVESIDIGKFGNFSNSNLSSLVPDIWKIGQSGNMSARYAQAKANYVGGYDAEIAANAAIKLVNDANAKKQQNNLDFWNLITNATHSDNKWERIGAWVALAALFINEQQLSIPMPNIRINNFNSRSHRSKNDK